MKKIMIFAAAAALLSLSSCGKEEIKNVTDASSNGSPVFTASINPGTKTTVNAQDGKVAWEETDVITITDGGGNTATYYISGIDGSTGKATFEYSSGDELGAGPYSASYGEQPEEAQTYSATAPGKLPMTASSQDNVLTFTVKCALMEINLTKDGESVKKIEVTGTPEGEEETTYTLTCTEPVSIAEKKAFYIALPAGTYTKIVITDSEDKVCTLNVKAQGIPVTVNQIIPATFDAEHLDFKANLPDGALPGLFSVSATKTVNFSQGNLWYGKVGSASAATFQFEAEQYEYHTYDSTNDTWGFFGWVGASSTVFTSSPQIYGVSTSNIYSDYGFVKNEALKADWGKAIDNNDTWRTLSKAEWKYLFNTRIDANSKVGFATVGGVNGIIILPDTFTDPMKNNGSAAFAPKSTTGWNANVYKTGGNWEAMESAGAVFLPAARDRKGSELLTVDRGSYWSSTAHESPQKLDCAYYMLFSGSFFTPDNYSSRYYGYSVRLVTDAN